VGRQLKALRRAHLLFELDRGIDRHTQRRRAKARWALDPFASEIWRPVVEECLERIAEEDGHDGRWYQRAVSALDAFDRRNRGMRNRIGEDMAIPPDQQKKRRRKGRKQSQGAKSAPGRKMRLEGRCFTRGVEAKPSENGKQQGKAVDAGPRASRPAPNGVDPQKNGPDSAVEQTRDRPEGQAPRGFSGVQGAKSAPASEVRP
jgi:hypothetical protein